MFRENRQLIENPRRHSGRYRLRNSNIVRRKHCCKIPQTDLLSPFDILWFHSTMKTYQDQVPITIFPFLTSKFNDQVIFFRLSETTELFYFVWVENNNWALISRPAYRRTDRQIYIKSCQSCWLIPFWRNLDIKLIFFLQFESTSPTHMEQFICWIWQLLHWFTDR